MLDNSNAHSMKIVFAIALLWLPLSIVSAEAQRTTPRLIASEITSTAAKRVVIDVSKARGAFRNIRLINARGPRIRFRNVRIVYSDGRSDQIGRAFSLRSGERTKNLIKSNTLKFVDKVIADIRPTGRRRAGRVRLEVLGIQTPREARLTRQGGITADLSPDPGDHDVLFGYRTVGLDLDRDEIIVGRNVGQFSHLRLNVYDNDVTIRDVRIDYVDGSVQFIPFGVRLKKGTSSEWFEVYKNRFIEKIVLIYRPSKARQKRTARVEVTGQYAENWLDPKGIGRKFNDGWVLLGAETAGAIGYDTDTIKVGRNKGGFKEIRLQVRDRSITLRQLRVVYTNGESDIFRLTQRVDPGQTVGPFALPKGKSAIRKIVAKYRSRLFFGKGKGTAMVEVWGRY